MVSQTLRLREGAGLDQHPPALTLGTARLPLRDPKPATREALRALAGAGLDPGLLAPQPELAMLVNRLEASGWIARAIESEERRLATREPLAFVDVLTRRGVDPDVPVKLSRFAFLHSQDGQLVVESGMARAKVVLHDSGLAASIAALAQPRLPDELEAPRELLALLVGAGLVIRLDDRADPEQDEPALAQWDPIDLLFHAHSRLGRREPSYGGTYPYRGRFAEPPAIRSDTADGIPLPHPDLDAVALADPPLTHAIERRRSIRAHDDERPISSAQLGELLFRTCRVTQVVKDASGGEFALRPYPAGGGLYELELYPVVRLCTGVEGGLYRYDPVGHALISVSELGPPAQGLLDQARAAAEMGQVPQVLLVIAARFPRVNWKYEGVAYALTLKHVGVLYQTLYLVATAMGVAPCALGGGDSDLFARAAGLDYAAETSVGEFIVGSRPAGWAPGGDAETAAQTS